MEQRDVRARVEALRRTILSHLDEETHPELKSLLQEERPANLVEAIRLLGPDERAELFILLDPDLAVFILEESEDDVRSDLLRELDTAVISDLVEQLPPDEAADAIQELPEKVSEEVIDQLELPPDEEEEVRTLLEYPPESAGGIMTTEYVAVPSGSNAQEVIERIRSADHSEPTFDVYVTDSDDRLIGVASLENVVKAAPATSVDRLMDREVDSVNHKVDQEEVVRFFKMLDIPAIPVVDDDSVLVGRITFDDLADVMEEEVTEDIYRLGGTDQEELGERSPAKIARVRLPWLMMCLLGSLLTAYVMHLYSPTLKEFFIVVVFVPVIIATGGNAGLQTTTVTVRSLATGRLSAALMLPAFFREMRVALLTGLACGVTVAVAGILGSDSAVVGGTIGIAMFLAVFVAACVGILAPWFFDRMGIDPAVASGPLVTTVNDLLGVSMYLMLASWMLQATGKM